MPGLQLMPLHWGQVSRTLNISGVKPVGKIKQPIKGAGIKKAIGSRGAGRIAGKC